MSAMDSAELAVLIAQLTGIATEMGEVLRRAAFSPNIKERMDASAALFTADMMPVFWTGGLQGSGPPRLAERLDTQRAALAVPRQMEVLEGWQRRALGVGYFDEDYHSTQMWKADWEAVDGDRVAARARATLEMLEPLRGPVGSPPTPGDGEPRGESPEGSPG